MPQDATPAPGFAEEQASTLEPYLQIVAPNLDQISHDLVKSGTPANRRARRGLLILLTMLLAAGAVITTSFFLLR